MFKQMENTGRLNFNAHLKPGDDSPIHPQHGHIEEILIRITEREVVLLSTPPEGQPPVVIAYMPLHHGQFAAVSIDIQTVNDLKATVAAIVEQERENLEAADQIGKTVAARVRQMFEEVTQEKGTEKKED